MLNLCYESALKMFLCFELLPASQEAFTPINHMAHCRALVCQNVEMASQFAQDVLYL